MGDTKSRKAEMHRMQEPMVEPREPLQGSGRLHGPGLFYRRKGQSS